MPLPALGLLGMLANVGRAGATGYRAFKTARAAQPAAKQLFKMEGSGLQKGLSALAKGERKLFKKSPLTAGGIETGLSAPFAAEGVMDVGKGLYENDYTATVRGALRYRFNYLNEKPNTIEVQFVRDGARQMNDIVSISDLIP